MLTIYEFRAGELKPRTGKLAAKAAITEEAVWIDLLDPTPEEEGKVEKALKLDVPTREEQQEIEASSRLYQEDGALFMTASVITQSDQAETKMTPVTFILAGNRLRHGALRRAARLRHLRRALQSRRSPTSGAAPTC